MNHKKSIYLALTYFFLSTVITGWFVIVCPLYTSLQQQLLSTGIAGAKWSIQLITAYFLLGDKKWGFLKNIGGTCLMGSVILLPYAIMAQFGGNNSAEFFVGSLLVAVAVMVISYFINVKRSGVPTWWFWGWIICLAIAISLQLTVVFSVIKF